MTSACTVCMYMYSGSTEQVSHGTTVGSLSRNRIDCSVSDWDRRRHHWNRHQRSCRTCWRLPGACNRILLFVSIRMDLIMN